MLRGLVCSEMCIRDSRYATGENKMSFSADYVFPTRAEIASFWNFFDAHMGRLSAFWLPSHGRDIVPAAAVGAEETRLTIEPISYASTYFTNELQGRHIYACLLYTSPSPRDS